MHVLRLAPRLQLLQRPHHLRLRVPALRHSPSPFLRPKSYSDLFGKRGAGQEVAVTKTTLCLALVIMSCGLALAQAQYEILWSFAGGPNDGSTPLSSLVLDHDGNLYGTTAFGGTTSDCHGCGTVFELSPDPDGSWTESILYDFCETYANSLCLDGAVPKAGLILDAQGNLYGTTASGGAHSCPFVGGGCGTIFELLPPSSPGNTWTEVVLYNFCGNYSNGTCLDGAVPTSQLTFDASGSLYGTTTTGGSGGNSGGCCVGGTVFQLSPHISGWSETVLYNFCATGHNNICPDGAAPQAGVTFDRSGNLYGTTEGGGAPKSQGEGTVYKLSHGSSGWTETVLLASNGPYGNGENPLGAVSFDTYGNLYSTFSALGLNGGGGVFKLTPGGNATEFSFGMSDGNMPAAGVLVDSRHATLYGTTSSGGTSNGGTVFSIVAPKQENVLYSFCSQTNCTDGDEPSASLVMDKSGNLYGTTKFGGASNLGSVFKVIPPPKPPTRHPVSVRSLLANNH